MKYLGRFAPSPTGPLHAGSLVAAMASYLDARAHGGDWLLRIEDIDPPREVKGASVQIIQILAGYGFSWQGPVCFQRQRTDHYQSAFDQLSGVGLTYPCACSRKVIGEAPYPGTCRQGMPAGRAARAFRVRTEGQTILWHDRISGEISENIDQSPGDFVLKRADGLWAYQLAVVVDDGLQGITHIVRGEDLKESTARQILLQKMLSMPTPSYLHVPVVKAGDGQKLSKQTGAQALTLSDPLSALAQAGVHLGLGRIQADSIEQFWVRATQAWAALHIAPSSTSQTTAG
jgi:glutamyl-Q tRNA(Asp) synthetase